MTPTQPGVRWLLHQGRRRRPHTQPAPTRMDIPSRHRATQASPHHTTLPPPLRDMESVICYILTQDEKQPTSITGTHKRCIHHTTLAGLSRDVNSYPYGTPISVKYIVKVLILLCR